MELFKEKRSLLENRGAFIIRWETTREFGQHPASIISTNFHNSMFSSQLCILLNAEVIYRIFAEIIFEETSNFKFASTMVRTLNTILLTTSELFELRMRLKDITNKVTTKHIMELDPIDSSSFWLFANHNTICIHPKESKELFKCLYMSWAHCPVSTLSLCLLGQCYQHASQLVVLLYVCQGINWKKNIWVLHSEFDMELPFSFLALTSKWRLNFSSSWINWCNCLSHQYLHVSFVFFSQLNNIMMIMVSTNKTMFLLIAALRLSLVSQNTAEAQYLSQALFGILMLLPQTEAFTLLKNRLQCIPHSVKNNSYVIWYCTGKIPIQIHQKSLHQHLSPIEHSRKMIVPNWNCTFVASDT